MIKKILSKLLIGISFISILIPGSSIAVTKQFQVDTGGTLMTSLVSYYKLGDATDFNGTNHLTNNGTVTFGAGLLGNGAILASGKYLSNATNIGIAGNGDISISFWFKAASEPGTNVIYQLADHMSTTGADRYLRVQYADVSGTKLLRVRFGDGTGQTYNVTLGTSTFHHIVVTRNVSGNVGKMYVDNVERTSNALGSSGFTANLIQFGESGGVTAGTMDEVGYWSKVLTTTEISDLYNGGAGQTMITPASAPTRRIKGIGISR